MKIGERIARTIVTHFTFLIQHLDALCNKACARHNTDAKKTSCYQFPCERLVDYSRFQLKLRNAIPNPDVLEAALLVLMVVQKI